MRRMNEAPQALYDAVRAGDERWDQAAGVVNRQERLLAPLREELERRLVGHGPPGQEGSPAVWLAAVGDAFARVEHTARRHQRAALDDALVALAGVCMAWLEARGH